MFAGGLALLRSNHTDAGELFFEVLLFARGTFVLFVFKVSKGEWEGKRISAVQALEFIDWHIHLRIIERGPTQII